MIFITVRHDERLCGARVEGDRTALLDVPDAVAAWHASERLSEWDEVDTETAHFDRVSQAAEYVICVGLDYRSHIEQLGWDVPEYPTLFAKFDSTLTGLRDSITLPAVSEHVQGEAELAAIIGRDLYRASTEDAAKAIAGYAIANGISMRDWQHRIRQAPRGKVFDRSTPFGPWLATPDEVDDARDL